MRFGKKTPGITAVLAKQVLLNRISNRFCMDGLLATALAVFLSIFNGSGAPAADAHAQSADVCVTPSLNATVAQQYIGREMEKCDSIADKDARNLCYALASKDSFFCDRICDQNLKNNCLTKISS
jgi:hypothetical protein